MTQSSCSKEVIQPLEVRHERAGPALTAQINVTTGIANARIDCCRPKMARGARLYGSVDKAEGSPGARPRNSRGHQGEVALADVHTQRASAGTL